VRVYESWEYDLPSAVDLENFLPIFLDPPIAQRIASLSDRNNSAAKAEHSGVFEHTEFSELRASTRTVARFVLQREQL